MVESLASLCAIALVLSVVDGKPTTTSLDIARHFGRPHDEVLRRIRNLIAQLEGEYLRNFAEVTHEYQNGKGGTQTAPAYRITRDGFTLLAMGFTGKKALQFKLAYIDAFNKMEAQIAELSNSANRLPGSQLDGYPVASADIPRVPPKPSAMTRALVESIKARELPQADVMALADACNMRLFMAASAIKDRGYGEEVAQRINAGLSFADLRAINIAASLEMCARTLQTPTVE